MKETNMEHYRGEIETACHGIKLKNGEIYMCHGAAKCSDCEFRDMYAGLGCQRAIVRWLMSEYKPEPVLTQREKGFVECIRHGWIAADEVGSKMWYEDKPKKDKEPNVWLGKKIVTLNDDYFPFITWEDEEPWSVEELRKLKVQNEDNI